MGESAKFRFTKARIEALEPPQTGRRYYYCERTPGLAVCVTASGLRTFFVIGRVGGTDPGKVPIRHRLGRYPELSVGAARAQAEQVRARMAAGHDPNAQKRARRAGQQALADLWEVVLVDLRRTKSARTVREYESQWGSHLSRLGSKPLDRPLREWVTDINRLHKRLSSTPILANRILALASMLFSQATKRGRWDHLNPARLVDKFRETSRERVLQPAEIKRLLSSLDAEECPTARDLFRVLVFSAARVSEARTMRWRDVDLTDGVWTIPATKNGRPHVVGLPAHILELLQKRRAQAAPRDEWVFPSPLHPERPIAYPKTQWGRIRKRAGLPDVRIHDLRRTNATIAANRGVGGPVLGRVLNHKSVQSTAVYTRVGLAAQRQVLEDTAREILGGETE